MKLRLLIALSCLGLSASVGCALADSASASATPHRFYFTVKKAGNTSAGVYDASGKLVKILWTLKPMQAGEQPGTWDGTDAEGNAAPEGKYSYRVVVNHSTYKNVGVIGNSGTNTFNHVPNNFECVAVDAEGNAYTVHDWDEPHHDVKMWSAKDGRVISHSGHVIGGLIKAVAVDGTFAYTTSYDNLDNRQDAKFFISKVRIDKTPGVQSWKREAFTKAGNELYVYNGNNSSAYPDGVSDTDKGVMRMPLLSLAVAGDTLYCTDSLAGKVRRFDKTSGEEKDPLEVPLPQSVAVADDGKIWVGHEHSKVSVFDANGQLLGTPVTDIQDVIAVAVHGGQLYVADQGAGQVKIYTIDGNGATFLKTFGDKARPGDRASHRFYNLHGLAVDNAGNIITAQNEYFFNGGRLAKSDPTGKPLWEESGLEFVSNGTYSQTNPDWFISAQHHGYTLDRQAGIAKSSGNTYSGEGYKSTIGPMRATKIGANEFVFMGNGDGMIVYRVVPPADKFRGPTLKMASIIAGYGPGPKGSDLPEPWKPENQYLWSWHDMQGDGKVQDGEQTIFFDPSNTPGMWQHGPMSADPRGNLWFTSADWVSGRASWEVWVIPMSGLDKLGNPIYDWRTARRATSKDQTKIAGTITLLKMAQAGGDGSIYAYGVTGKPGAPTSPGLHMGGNVLMRFTLKKGAKLDAPDGSALANGPVPNGSPISLETPVLTDLQWKTLIPEMCVGLDVVPPRANGKGGGVMIGGYPFRGGIHHYTADGLLIGAFNSDEKRFGGVKDDGNNPSGLIDYYGGVSVNRDPRDGMLDVFVEDDYNDRIFWYRVDDSDIETLSGTLDQS